MKKSAPPSSRKLTGDELRDWQEATKHDRKLRPGEHMTMPETMPDETLHKPPRQMIKKYRQKQAISLSSVSSETPLVLGELQMDARAAGRVKRGRYPIDRKLDLHGLNREAAQDRLTAAIQAAHASGQRCLLVITGKGTVRVSTQAPSDGILRGMLPRWLNDAPLKPLVLGFEQAQPAHGGAGAFYVLIRRRRE